ncbi:hypothetical protein PABG_01831 [Paracoccidioides brasiliensis Pb03]|nr:hypothetical protein PABG_01831 [Paracoccidioides brasiliensis Pb03]
MPSQPAALNAIRERKGRYRSTHATEIYIMVHLTLEGSSLNIIEKASGRSGHLQHEVLTAPICSWGPAPWARLLRKVVALVVGDGVVLPKGIRWCHLRARDEERLY